MRNTKAVIRIILCSCGLSAIFFYIIDAFYPTTDPSAFIVSAVFGAILMILVKKLEGYFD
jgi:hypothetical protein